jgi:hypothetical protein
MIANNKLFANSKIYLIFNKYDLFKQNIKKHNINDYQSGFNGDETSVNDVFHFIKSRYLKCDLSEEGRIKNFYKVCCLDKEEVDDLLKTIFNDIIMDFDFTKFE